MPCLAANRQAAMKHCVVIASLLYVGACVEGSVHEQILECVVDVQLHLLLSPSINRR